MQPKAVCPDSAVVIDLERAISSLANKVAAGGAARVGPASPPVHTAAPDDDRESAAKVRNNYHIALVPGGRYARVRG